MATKTFKIGECAKGGVITVNISPVLSTITVIGKEWDYSTGSHKNSDQSNAKEFINKNFIPTNDNCYRELSDFLCDLTTSYYADMIIKWIETKVKITRSLRW